MYVRSMTINVDNFSAYIPPGKKNYQKRQNKIKKKQI